MVITYTDKLQKALRFQEKVIDTTKAHTDLLKTAMDDNSKVFLNFWGLGLEFSDNIRKIFLFKKNKKLDSL